MSQITGDRLYLPINQSAMFESNDLLFLFFGNLSSGELILIFAVVLLLFGARRIPELAKGLGKGIREFKDATSGIKREIEKDADSGTENRS
jgi:sec-independent protein translocase protein TatA